MMQKLIQIAHLTVVKCIISNDTQMEIMASLLTALQVGIMIGQKQYSFDSIEELEKGKKK